MIKRTGLMKPNGTRSGTAATRRKDRPASPDTGLLDDRRQSHADAPVWQGQWKTLRYL